ncbi:extracellular solute-binding protein [Glaciihabitans sp. UYNi722]|uniref:extracellular solute-binding protein n=1 Tax=Glaciihabitans sp. UYNi722 TaxID=3156344 RepID=UPI0033909F2A
MTTTLRGITWEHARGYGSVVAAAEAYRRVRPDVEVHWEFRSLQAFADQPIEALVAQYDLLVIDHPHIPLAAEHGLFAELDGRGFDDELTMLAAQTVGRCHESYSYAGHQWGLATDAAAQVAAYRPDLLATPPGTWPDVLELAREGRVLWPAKPIDAFSSLVTIAANNGTPPMSEPGVFLQADEAAPVLALLRELASLVPSDNLGLNPIQVADQLAEGDRFAYAPLLFGYTNYSRDGFRANRLAYVDIPSGARGVRGSLLGGAGIAVSAASSHLDEAIAHAFWLDSAAVQAGVYYDGGGQPGNAVAWESDRTNSDSLDFFRGTRATLEGAYLRPRHPRYIDLQDAVSPLVTAALRGELTDSELVSELNDGVVTYLGA